MKTGRNAPCPCGSGKKHKQCCLSKQASIPSSTDLTWRRIRHEMDGLPMRMLGFIGEAYGTAAMAEAWEEFTLWDEHAGDFDPETPHLPVFMPWFLHCWSPNPDETNIADNRLHEVTPTQAWLRRKGHQLAPVTRTYLKSCVTRSFSFYEVEQVEPGRRATLCDLITGERHNAYDQSATHALHAHDLVYALLGSANGVTLIEGLGPAAFAPSDKVEIIQLRKRMRRHASAEASAAASIEPDMWALELRQLYLSIMDRILYPATPHMTTSDGDTLEFHQQVYDIDSAQTAFDALKHLDAIAEDPDDAPSSDIRRDANGAIEHAHIEWSELDQGEDVTSGTLLGSIDIDDRRLTAQTRSREQAERLKGIIETALANHASFRVDKIQTVEQMLADDPRSPPSSPSLPDDPGAQQVMADYLRKHYTEWIDTPLPALGDHTPRHVAQTPDGREQVEALLQDAQNHVPQLSAATRETIFDDIRQQLGLKT